MQRRAISIRGIVQGVGFRPFVFGLASRFGLGGFVRNENGSVKIEVEGEPAALDQFVAELSAHPPALARIEELTCGAIDALGEREFQIELSAGGGSDGSVFISPDVATCDDCLRELFDPADRRYLYPFINCANCGPRLTIVTGAPYDRHRTTMASFAMCRECQQEYDNPRDRRFHAQPTCCPRCGPRLELVGAEGDPLPCVAEALRGGRIVAIKGLGGFHLACNALDESAVQTLRGRKHREEKPFALMVADVAAAAALCEVSSLEAELLSSPRRPIVLLHRRTPAGLPFADSIAPGNPYLGVMLPYTPLHHLLLREVNGLPLVMTSANQSDEPIAFENDDALRRLNTIADLFLLHDRAIHVRCDDSVTRMAGEAELPLRRSRGYAPQPIRLPQRCAVPTLAVGGQLKGTFALGRDDQAFVSHHLGDLDHYEAFKAFQRDVKLYEQLFQVQPKRIVHDLHPDYASTAYARRRAAEEGITLLGVQHHHAHMASCMAEHGLKEPVIGVSFDGTGFGPDGAIWGGEFLVGDYATYQRAAHLRYVPMPGGDAAIREPWRMAMAHLLDADCDDGILHNRIPEPSRKTVRQMIQRGFNTPRTSSAGRLFDAVAALAAVRDHVSYEGQAAIELEWLATSDHTSDVYPFAAEKIDEPSPIQIDTRPIIREIIHDLRRGVFSAQIARRFHSTMVELIAVVCRQLRKTSGLNTVVLSGGVFMNVLLSTETTARLKAEKFRVFSHCQIPPNDGGLSFGQLAVAAALDA
jgi:hydrogenase maturation protein HypF